ncbi:MAG: hypothetical protein ACD_2C00212G0003 [uncultured bacterium (gcode 4)]|uniref:Uncharacterized protein n=1 Tax=uncultured bacterium (gcode 4) TaxID=1234023 RepID=K2G1W1_9BACT|nr:MAG: hypothetical protein ACD_2C00212G0003 [uncultured bacterium (gcode 4)]
MRITPDYKMDHLQICIKTEVMEKITVFLNRIKEPGLLKAIHDTNDINVIEWNWWQPILCDAIRHHELDLVKDLLDSWANPNDTFPYIWYNAYGWAKFVRDEAIADLVWNHPSYKRTIGDRLALTRNKVLMKIDRVFGIKFHRRRGFWW